MPVSSFPAGGIACPSCSRWLFAPADAVEVSCRCGRALPADLVREVSHLRTTVPGWVQRLEHLEQALADGSAAMPAPSSTAQPGFAPAGAMGAHTALVTVGALLVGAGLLALMLVLWNIAGPLGQVALLALATVLVAASSVALRSRTPMTASALSLVAVASWLVLALLVVHALAPDTLAVDGFGWSGLLAVTAALTGLLGAFVRMATWVRTAALAAPLAVACTVATVAVRVDVPALAVAAAAGLVVGAVALVCWDGPIGAPTRRLAASACVVLAPLLAFGAVVSEGRSGSWSVQALCGALCVAAWAAAKLSATRRLAPVLVGLAAGLVTAAGAPSVWLPLVLVVAVAAVGLLRPRPEVVTSGSAVAAVGAWLVLAAPVYAEETGLGWAYVAAAAAVAVVLAVRAARAGRAGDLAGSAAAAVLATLGTVGLLTADASSGQVEWFSVPVAAVLSGYAACASRMHRDAPSILTWGPAAGALLLPSALAALAVEDVRRVYAVLAVGCVLLLAGFATRRLGVFAPAAVALVVVAVRPASVLMTVVPHWIVYTAAGALLLAAGARFEVVRSRTRQARVWASGYFR